MHGIDLNLGTFATRKFDGPNTRLPPLGTCRRRATARGRILVATKGCFVGANHGRGRSERRTALEEPDGRLRVVP